MARPPMEPGEFGEINTGGVSASGKVRARTRYCTPTGKIIPIEATGKSKAEAMRKLKRRMDKWQPETAKSRFRDVAPMWLTDLTENTDLRPQSANRYDDALRTTICPIIGGRAIGGLTTGDLDAMFERIYREKPGMYNTAMTVTKGVFDYAVRRGMFPHSPMVSVRRRTVKPSKPVRALTLHELAGLRGMCREWQAGPRRTQPLLDLIDLALSTGARVSELLFLKWEDVDFDTRTVTLIGTQVWVRGVGIVGQDETKEGTRLRLPLTKFALSMLQERRADDPEGTYVFASRSGGMISRGNLNRAFRAARGDEFKWVTWHTFRKSVATLAAEHTDSATAAKLLGHTSDAVTRKHYIATDANAVPDLTAVLEGLAGDKVISFDDDDL